MLNLLKLHLVNHLLKVQVRYFSSKVHSLSLPVKEAAIGLILGDASLVRKYPNGNAYFKYAQSTKHTEYLNFVFSILEPYCNMTSPTLRSGQGLPRTHRRWSLGEPLRLGSKTYGVLSFTSRSLYCFTELHTLFYLDGIKLVPSNIADLLTPVGLAWLFPGN